MPSKAVRLPDTHVSKPPSVLPKTSIMRVARPTDNLKLISEMYCRGLSFNQLGHFADHQGFDGVILGHPHHTYHLEFTHHRGVRVGAAPTQDNLLVFYIPDEAQWVVQCQQMAAAKRSKIAMVIVWCYSNRNGSCRTKPATRAGLREQGLQYRHQAACWP